MRPPALHLATSSTRVRELGRPDLEQVDAVITQAVASWDLPERVKRLSLPSLRYGPQDLDHLTLVGAALSPRHLAGVAAWEPADAADNPRGKTALLLHGLYVRSDWHGSGVGTLLLDTAVRAAVDAGFDGLLVKAVRQSQGFFVSRGLRRLPVENAALEYPYRLWAEGAVNGCPDGARAANGPSIARASPDSPPL